jgi:hypothetical protein
VDWNNDGKFDLLSGDTDGNVWIFLNVGKKGKPELAEGMRVKANGKLIQGKTQTIKMVDGRAQLGEVLPASHELAEVYSKLHMADWDGDGLNDLLIGHSSTVVFYKNTGSKSDPKFGDPVIILDSFRTRPAPYVIDWDEDGKQDLLVGSDGNEIYFYRNIGTNKEPELADKKELVLEGAGFSDGNRVRVEVVDWNNDGKRDLLVGNYYMSVREGESRPTIGGNVWLFLGK